MVADGRKVGGTCSNSSSELSWPKPSCFAVIDTNAWSPSGARVTMKYKFVKRIGSGSFGEVWLGVNISTKEKVAIKVESTKAAVPQLQREFTLYDKYLKNITGFPQVEQFASTKHCTYFVMTLLGPSLQKLLTDCGGRFSLKTVLMIADQLLCRLEDLHSVTGHVSRDIKPENLLMGRRGSTKGEKTLHLIDLGLSKQFMDVDTQTHILRRSVRKNLTGTARYASINAHVLVYFLNGRLPWQKIKECSKKKRYDLIRDMKRSISTRELCRGLPLELCAYFDYCKELDFEEEPDYDYLRGLFQKLMMSHRYDYDFEFDWSRAGNGNGGGVGGHGGCAGRDGGAGVDNSALLPAAVANLRRDLMPVRQVRRMGQPL